MLSAPAIAPERPFLSVPGFSTWRRCAKVGSDMIEHHARPVSVLPGNLMAGDNVSDGSAYKRKLILD